MSERLHIGQTDDQVYDYVITANMEDHNIRDICNEFVSRQPIKMRIGDLKLYERVKPIIIEAFNDWRLDYPADLFFVYINEIALLHPTEKALEVAINNELNNKSKKVEN